MKYLYLSICCLIVNVSVFAEITSAKTLVYTPVPGLITSPDFQVKANGQAVWTERLGAGGMEDLNIANFSCSGVQTITITASEDIQNYLIHPKGNRLTAKVNGRELTFCIDGPQQLYIEINALPHLALFANPLEENVPAPNARGVMYYGPGVHDAGDITLQSNQTIYIAGGASVNANIRGENVENVKILGRGYLNGNVRIDASRNIEVNGVFMRSTRGWTNTITDCYNTIYENVKIFSYRGVWGLDGIVPVSCKNFTINNCFIRTRDDCIAIKNMSRAANMDTDSVSITNCLLVGWDHADGVTLGFEMQGGYVKNVFVRDIDIIRTRGQGRTGGHSAFSIVCDGPAQISDIYFENIRAGADMEYKNLEIIITEGMRYGDGRIGSIDNVFLKNIHWENAKKPFVIAGVPSQLVGSITFQNCYVAGKLITKPEDAEFLIEFAREINFIPGGTFIPDRYPNDNYTRDRDSNIPGFRRERQ
jgi:polygalacturonase